MNEPNLEEENAKHVISIRTQPKLKYELCVEANKRGLTLSEYCENILANRNLLQLECITKKKILSEKGELEKRITELESKLESSLIIDTLSHERLLYLFTNLQGKDDLVENAYGVNFNITYTTPQELLRAIIYSQKIKT